MADQRAAELRFLMDELDKYKQLALELSLKNKDLEEENERLKKETEK